VNPRLAKLLPWIGYPVFYVLALAFFAYLSFPYDRLKDRLIDEFNATQASSGLRIKIEELDSYWFSGVEADGVQFISTPPAGPEGKAPKPKVISLDNVHARVSLLRLLVGTLHISFGMEASGGEISGFTSDADNGRTLEAEFDSVKVSDVPMLADVVPLPIGGALNGDLELRLPEGKLAKADGKVALKISELTVGDGKSKIMNTIALPTLNAGELVLEGEATDGKLNVSKFTATGKDLELVADGGIRLRDPFASSLAELNLRFKFSPAYRNKNDTTRALLGAPGSNVPAVFDLDPRVRSAKRPDDFYAWRLNGPLGHLNPEPAAMAGSMGGSAPRPPSGFADEP
jgi:type II secretion system protein N